MRCTYCKVEISWDRHRQHDRRATKDHLIPRRNGHKGGPTVQACYSCNNARGDLPLGEFLTILAQMRASDGRIDRNGLKHACRRAQSNRSKRMQKGPVKFKDYRSDLESDKDMDAVLGEPEKGTLAYALRHGR